MSSFAGISDLVQEIKEASHNIELGDARTGKRLDAIEKSVNELFLKTHRPGAEWHGGDDPERADAAEMCRIRHHEKSPKDDGITTKEYVPTNTELEEALIAGKAFRSYLRAGGDVSRLNPTHTKSLSAVFIWWQRFYAASAAGEF